MINVMFIADVYHFPRAGTEVQMYELMTNLDPGLFNVSLLLFRNGDPAPEMLHPRVLGLTSFLRPSAIPKLCNLTSILKQNKIDIVHVFLNDAITMAPFFSKISGARVITSRRDMGFWYTSAKLWALRVANRFVDVIVANSQAVRQRVIIKEAVAADRVKVIYNGHKENRFLVDADPDFREKYKIGRNDPVIGMVANLYARKRQSDLINALGIIHRRYDNAHLVFVGGGDDIASLQTLAHNLGFSRYVHFTGSLVEPVAVIKHFDVCVLCSESEGLSNAIIEYMACQKPIVCTWTGGNTELVRDGIGGLLVGVGDIEGLAARIIKLLSNQNLAEQLSKRASQLFLESYTTDKMIAAHTQLYSSLVYNRLTNVFREVLRIAPNVGNSPSGGCHGEAGDPFVTG